ncbi:MAG: hypothetical protein RL033_7754 [Pseudomonadota bacterium]|jgi:lipid-A-disaccharide synthase-like uncharacterized protein
MTVWSAVGFTGTALFASRWLVQMQSSRRAGRSVVTPVFWAISVSGSLLQATYFGLGPHFDEVGLLGSALPFITALYNLILSLRAEARKRAPTADVAAAEQS